jgi:hypothetical protein
MASNGNIKKIMKVTKSEFWIDDGSHVVFDMIARCVTVYKHGHMSRTIKTKRLPTIINAIWVVKNYPLKSTEN